MLIIFFIAKLLCKSHHNRIGEKDCHLLEAADRRK
jgi:hypothetical protein